MQQVNFRLRGLTPLLMHNPASMANTGPKVRLGKQQFDPKEDAQTSRYLLPDGNFYVPAVAVRNSLLGGTKGMRAGKVALSSVFSGGVELMDEVFPLTDDSGDPISGDNYTLDSRRVVIKGNGIIRSRARIELPWNVLCIFMIELDLVSGETLVMVAERAGRVVGLLDYRPAKSGWFGKYEIIEDSIDM